MKPKEIDVIVKALKFITKVSDKQETDGNGSLLTYEERGIAIFLVRRFAIGARVRTGFRKELNTSE